MAEEKKFTESKKAKGLVIGIASIIVSAAAGVATGGVTSAIALPMVIDGIKWLVVGYFAAQGGQDAVGLLKKNKADPAKNSEEAK